MTYQEVIFILYFHLPKLKSSIKSSVAQLPDYPKITAQHITVIINAIKIIHSLDQIKITFL